MTAKSTVPTKRLVLLDAHALLHRAYHALPEFTNSHGIPTGGLFGYASMIIRIIADWKPDYIVACYDLPQKTFRHEAYDAYKGKRSKTDDALKIQIEESRRICDAFCIPIYDQPGFEADDMLGTIVEQLHPHTPPSRPTPANKDDSSAATPPLKGEDSATSDLVEVLIATGDMDTLQLVQGKKVRVFTLKKGMNDTVVYDEDAVIERFGFGPELLPDYKGLRGDPSDNIIGVPGIGEKTATELILKFGTLEQLYATLHKDREVFIKEGIKERIVKLLEEHEEQALFSKTLATIRRDAPITFALPDKTWRETCSFDHAETTLKKYEFKSLVARLKDLLTSENAAAPGPRGAANAQEPSRTAQIALWLLDSEKTAATANDILSYANASTLDDAEKKLVAELHEQDLGFIFNDIECPLIPILSEMQHHGILINRDYLKNLSSELHGHLKSAEQKIYDYVGHEFNINSPKQLGEIIFGELQLHAGIKGFRVKKTASGTYSTRESDLEKLAESLDHEQGQLIRDIFEYRELQKLLSTYIDNLPGMLDADSRLHPELIQTGTTTGRFSSQNPNIQNIPIRSELGRKIRHAFIAPPGYSILAADYSQIELRAAAILSGDPVLIETFREHKDVHASVAAQVFHVPEHEVTGNMRRQAKVINFGILYGMGVTALQKNLGTTRKEAQEFYDEYFKRLPKLAEYLDETILQAKKLGYTQTLFGRRRHFPALRSPLPYIKAMAERAASNAPIQGMPADMIKLAMIQITEKLKQANLSDRVHMTMQIHDELVFEVADEVLPQAQAIIKETMEHVLETVPFDIRNKVPIEVSVSSGKNWGETKE